MKNLINELSAELEALDFEETGIESMLERPVQHISERSVKYQELSKRLEDLETMAALLHSTTESHTSWSRGYVSRKKPEGTLAKYAGKFGKGFVKFTPSWESTRYCFVTYYLEIEA